MATTPIITVLTRNSRRVVLHVAITYAASDLTNAVLYDSSVQAALITGLNGVAYADPLTCALNSVQFANNSAAGLIKLNFDASSPVLVTVIPQNKAGVIDFSFYGGLKNYAGSGITGDITITSNGLASNETIELILDVCPMV